MFVDAGNFIRFISHHPDHDSVYDESCGATYQKPDTSIEDCQEPDWSAGYEPNI